MVDQHLHCNFSPDSKADLFDYLKLMEEAGNEYLNLTDHFDYLENLKDLIPFDYMTSMRKQHAFIKSLKEPVYSGIEVGYNKEHEEKVKNFLSEFDHSIILLSIHDNDENRIQYCIASSYDTPTDDVVKLYFKQMLEAVNSSIDFDVLTHIGYVFRYTKGEVEPLNYLEEVKKVLEALVKKDRALEINTGCLSRGTYDAHTFYAEVLKIYKELGGYKLSLGSDAHSLKDYCRLFEDAKKLLRDNGFNEVTIIKNRVHTQVAI